MKPLLCVVAGLVMLCTSACSTCYAKVSDGNVSAEWGMDGVVSRAEVTGPGAEITALPPLVVEVGADDTIHVAGSERVYRVNDHVEGTDYRIKSVSRAHDRILVTFAPAE